MASRQNLKQKLKATDRRRRRRIARHDSSDSSTPAASSPVASQTSTQTASEPSVDAFGMIARTILEFRDSAGVTKDAVVVAAMRSCLNATKPSGAESRRLHERLDAIIHQPGTDLREYRTAIREMMELAKQHQNPKNAAAFQEYLALLSN